MRGRRRFSRRRRAVMCGASSSSAPAASTPPRASRRARPRFLIAPACDVRGAAPTRVWRSRLHRPSPTRCSPTRPPHAAPADRLSTARRPARSSTFIYSVTLVAAVFLAGVIAHRDVLHLVGAQGRRPHAEPARAQPRRADRAAPVAGRRDQAADQGRPDPARTRTSSCSGSRRTSRSPRRSRRSSRCRSGRT